MYEEFGCILLLVLAFYYRYDLTVLDLGITDRHSFIARLLERSHTAQRLDSLPEHTARQFCGWVSGLFQPETCISDELMSACPPQDFYLLVPTLFSQSVLACHTEAMSLETLKGGLECTVSRVSSFK